MAEQHLAHLSVEKLEDRCVPAGVVRTSFRFGLLRVIGDNLNNSVRLQFDSTGRRVSVLGLSNTAIVGPNFANGVRNIRVEMQGGNDMVFIWGGRFAGSISVDLGKGTDRAIFANTFIADKLTVSDPSGAAEIAMTAVNIDKSVAILTGPQSNRVDLVQSNIGGPFLLDTGDGNDTVRFSGTNFNGSFLTLLGDGNDTMTMSNCFLAQPGVLDGGDGLDIVTLNNLLGGTPLIFGIP